MKEGLTFISERTGQIRYADHSEKEQWVQQLSTFIPIQEIKRGQPVSVATKEDLKRIADGNEDLYEALLNSSDTYIVLTNPAIHTNTVGLALEYTKGEVELTEEGLKVANKIHIIGQGQYIEDKDYYSQAFTDTDNVTVAGDVDSEFEEYWPPFFDDYENSIGKKIYVKGSVEGQLTLVPEEAYLAHNNVIIVGFVTDAKIKDKENFLNVGAIEVQIEGDDRGIIDATTFEAVVGEDFVIGDSVIQSNGETSCSKTKVFALGCEDDDTFKFSFNINQLVNTNMPKGFIALQRIDGKTFIIYTNGEIEDLNNENYDYNDRAFIQVAKYYAANYGEAIESTDLAITEADNISLITKLQAALRNAMKFVSQGENKSLLDGHISNITDLLFDESELGTKHRLICSANDIGGYFDVYVSSNLTGILSDLNIASHGSFYNRGYAVLADIRNKNRQNIIGIYNSGHIGLVEKGENAIFLKQGLFRDSSSPYEKGERYYLGSHGNIFKVPQEYYNSIISIGYAQYEDALIVDCCDSRQYNNGDLPVGYMKPSVKGEAEFGFLLMDGSWTEYEGKELLYKRMLNWYDPKDLNLSSHNFGAGDDDNFKMGFIIPKVVYQRHTGEELSTTPAQIKWLAEGVYKEMPRTPFVRRYVDIDYPRTEDGILCRQARIPDIDITPLMIYGPEEDRLQVPDLENLDIKLFVDMSDGNVSEWTQIDPGFHTSDNFTYFGYKWTVTQTDEPSESHPYGTWVLRAAYNGTQGPNEVDNDNSALGICYQADPYSPPRSLAGRRARVFVTKHDYYSRQFDVEALFKDYVKESVVDATDKPWVSNAVSGAAVRQDIYRRVYTKDLLLGSDERKADVKGWIQSIVLKGDSVDNEDNLVNFTLETNLRFKNPDNAGGPFIDFYNGLFKYYYENETEDNLILHKASLSTKILNEKYALLPSFMFKEHRDLLVNDAAANDYTEHPHGIVNEGFPGNLNAKTLQSANLGYPQHILANNATEDVNEAYNELTNAAIAITIPYTQKLSSGGYRTRLGNITEYRDGTGSLKTETLEILGPQSQIVEAIDIKNGSNYVASIRGNKDNVTSHLNIDFNFVEKKVSFLDEEDNALKIYGDYIQASSIQKKYVLSRFETENVPTVGGSYADKYVNFEEPTLKEALQAIYEMPLATFKYNREYEAEDSEYYKRYFGIVVERIADAKNAFKDGTNLNNNTTYDNVNYVYTEDEKKSISEYLNLVTDNNEQGMVTNTVVGILLKAAQETQQRLLNLEISTYGKDSPTLPGADTPNANFAANDQHSTIAGLNRLVKALCREVFQDADPTNINELGGWSEGSDNYSRLDLLDKEVNGEDAKNDTQNRIFITADIGKTYPDDASVTETVDHSHSVVGDAENNDDFGREDAVQYPHQLEYAYEKEDVDDFDGLNDAVNRIVAKLNTLTEDVIGEDDIKMRPKKLDYIRGSLETLIRELYSDNTESGDIENGAYVKGSLSRIDKILQDLYNFDLTYGETRARDQKYNGRTLYGDEVDVEADDNQIGSFASRSPEKIEDIYNKASILDVIIELLAGKEKDLVKTKSTSWKDLANNEQNWKKSSEGAIATSYNNAGEQANNEISRNHYTVLERLNDIEKSLALIYSRFANKTEFYTDANRGLREGAYKKITAIDDVLNHLSDNTGLVYDAEGSYSLFREPDDETIYKRTDDAKAVTAESIRRPLYNTISDLDAYDIAYDAVKRIKNSEMNLAYNNAKLGTDYDTYKIGAARITKDAYEALLPNDTAPTPEYTVSSDMRAVLKLLYGYDLDNADESDNKTGFEHFKVTDERNDNFTKSPNGVSVIDALYKMLFNIPKAFTFSADGTTASELSGTVDEVYTTAKGYDPINLKRHQAVANNESPVGYGHRNDFMLSDGNVGSRKNRIDILEDWVKSIYTYIGFGNNTDPNYFSGHLHITFSAPDDKGVKDVLVNGKKYITTAYSEDYIKDSGTYTVVELALQSYYNTLKLKQVMGDNPNDYPPTWTYTLPTNGDSLVEITTQTSVTVSGVHAALNKLFAYTEALDTNLITTNQNLTRLRNDFDDYVEENDERVQAIEDEIGNVTDGAPDKTKTIWENIELLAGKETDIDPTLEAVGDDVILKNDVREQDNDKRVTAAAVQSYVAAMVEQLRAEYEEKCEIVKNQAIILAYLKVNSITVINGAIKIDKMGTNKDVVWQDGLRNPEVGVLRVYDDTQIKFGKPMRQIEILDEEEEVEYRCWFDYVDENASAVSAYRDYSINIDATVGNDVVAHYSFDATNGNDVVEHYDFDAENSNDVYSFDATKDNIVE